MLKSFLAMIGLCCIATLAHAAPGFELGKGNVAAGKTKSSTCVACHNQDGNSTTPEWPKIAGMAEGYLLKQLHNFQEGDAGSRYNALMWGIVQNLDEQDFADLAAYFSSQKMTPSKTPASSLALGEKIYRGGLPKGVPACSGCHGPHGMGLPAAYVPRLSGQHAAYVADQLRKFRAGERKNDMNGMMRGVAKHLSDDEIAAVSDYVAGLH